MADHVWINIPRIRRNRHFRGTNILEMGFSDEQLRQRFRFGRQSIRYLCNLLRRDLQRSTMKKTALSVEQQVLIALRFYASGSYLQVIGDTLGFDKSTVSRVITNVTNALIAHKNEFVKWPGSEAKRNEIKTGFFQKAGFPNVIGCVDGTHIRIQAPVRDEPSYVNRKNFHSINVQGICDHKGLFTNISAQWPGSTHDAHIFKTSTIGQHLQTNYRGINYGILLGDSGYPCRPFLLTPFKNPRQREDQRFNRCHGSTRSAIERTFGIWKRRFGLLHGEVRMRPSRACKFVMATAILHNIAIKRNEPIVEDEEQNDLQPDMAPYEGHQDGRGIREYYARSFFA